MGSSLFQSMGSPAAGIAPPLESFPAAVGEWSLTPVRAGLWASARTTVAPAEVRGLPAEPGRLGVVIDAPRPDAATDQLLAGLLPALARPGPAPSLRLVLSAAADRYGRAAADQLGLDVIAAEDQVTITPYGHGLVHPAAWLGDPGTGPDGGPSGLGDLAQWRRCLPGGESRPAGVLYPAPAWEQMLSASLPADLAQSATVRRIPAGLELGLPDQPEGSAEAANAVWPDPERLTIVMRQAGPPDALLDALARLLSALSLADTDGVRLYWPRAATGSIGQALRQLARGSGTDLIAPTADLEDSGGFGAVCRGPLGAAPWLRFTWNGDTQVLGSLYPVPGWERALTGAELLEVADGLVIEEVAAGVSLYRSASADSGLVATARSLPPDPRRMTIVVSDGLERREAPEVLLELLRQLPAAARDVRLLMSEAGAGGPSSLAQALADASGSPLVAPVGQWAATPDGRLRVADPEDGADAGTDGWAGFEPRSQAPALPREEAAPMMFAAPAVASPVVRRATADPALAEDVRLQVPVEQVAQEAAPRPEPEAAAPADEQPAPDVPKIDALPAAPSLPRAHRSSAQERLAYRESTASYQMHAVTVRRMLTQRPGLRTAATADSEEALITDFAALLDFLDAGPAVLQESLREAGTPRHPWVACVTSGLRRLPSYYGPVFAGAVPDGRPFHGYTPGQLIVEPSFVFASSAPQRILDGEVEYVIWSETAKRIASLWPEAARDEVVFAAGTAFRVLRAAPGTGPVKARFFLREVAPLAGHSSTSSTPGPGGAGQLDERDRDLLARLSEAATLRDGVAAGNQVVLERPRAAGPPLGVDQLGLLFQAGGR